MSATTHLKAAAAYIAVAESGDAERSAYEHAALEIEAAMRADPKLTQRDIAAYLGKNVSYVNRLLKALLRTRNNGEPFSVDWGSGSNRRSEVVRKTFERPEVFAEMVERATPEMRRKIIEAVTDPKTKAGRLISQHVYDQAAEQRRRQAEQARQRAQDKAMPLPAYMADMVVKMNEWALGLAALVDDLDDLPEGRSRELVAEAAAGLAKQAQRWVDRLDQKPNLRVIEGRAKSA